MTKKLEELLNLPPSDEELIPPTSAPPQEVIDLEDKLEEFDKISAALPKVKGLGDISDAELDTLAKKAEDAYDDLMSLGMNVDARFGGKIFEVAAQMMNAAIQAKTNKIDKKLKMVELQIKKLAIDRKNAPPEAQETVQGEGYILTDRNSILQKLKEMDK